VFFSSFIIKTPSPQKDGALKKRERQKVLKKERKKKSSKSLCKEKVEVNILREKKHFNFKIFLLESIPPPPLHHIIFRTLSKNV
jgi:hypothetical protein